MKAIRFDTEEVRATLGGRKTQTRRVVKPQPQYPYCLGTCSDSLNKKDIGCVGFTDDEKRIRLRELIRPRYQVGDILYVQETFGNYSLDNPYSNAVGWIYKADYPDGAKGYWYEPEKINWCDLPRWRPSIQMPKEAARIFLKVTNVHIKKLHDITCSDIIADGYPKEYDFNFLPRIQQALIFEWYKEAWNCKLKKADLDQYGWDCNPWIEIIEFEIYKKTEVI